MVTLAIDPGVRIGWATFGVGGEIDRGVISWEELVKLLWVDDEDRILHFMQWSINEVVIENYRVDPGTPQGGREVSASEVIGAVRYACAHSLVPFTRQEPSILSVAKKHTGYVDRKKHLPDEDSAFLHGYYYEETKGRLHPVPLRD